MKEAAFAVQSGTLYTLACEKYGVPRSSLQKVVKARSNLYIQADVPHRCGRPPALSKEEEALLVGPLVRNSSKGTPLADKHLKEAVRSLVLTMPPVRRQHLPFRGVTQSVRGHLERAIYRLFLSIVLAAWRQKDLRLVMLKR